MKKQDELDDIFRRAHMNPDPDTKHDNMMAIIDSGML
jgi:hypothetical protein